MEGQCRILAAGKVGFEEVPALIEELDDDEAVRRSWNENEKRTNLSASDKAHWFEKKFRAFLAQYQTRVEARRKTAAFFNVSESTVASYIVISVLPGRVQSDLDVGAITQAGAKSIAKSLDSKDPEGSEKAMEVKAGWFKGVDNADRKMAAEVLESKQVEATPEQLDEDLVKRKAEATSAILVLVPENVSGALKAYGESQGITNVSDIVSNAMMRTLRSEKLL